jgi:iron(III) transport system permease protein
MLRVALALITVLAAALVAVPVLSVAANVFAGGTGGTWSHLAATVLPDYIVATIALCVGVGIGSVMLGVGSAWLVTHLDFPLRRSFEWALVLPLAMPAYVMAYTYADVLQFAGPLQTSLRELMGWRRGDYWFPDVRSVGGAIVMLSCVLYPYVYLLVRIAFLERGAALLDAGRALGLTPWRSFLRVSLPMARPAIAAGAALALMETLADYGTVSYFGVQTFTTGIYHAWFSLGDRTAAAQLSTALLVFVLTVLAVERISRGQARFAATGTRRVAPPGIHLEGWRAALAVAGCAVPFALGFVVPCAILVRLALETGDAEFGPRFVALARNSFMLALMSACIACVLALVLAYARRIDPKPMTRAAHWFAGMGYAIPGSVIAVGLLIPLARLDNALAEWLRSSFGWHTGLLFTGGLAALVYACVVRFMATGPADGRLGPGADHAAHGRRGAQPRPAPRRRRWPGFTCPCCGAA